MEQCIIDIKEVWNNLRKTPNRIYTEKTAYSKLNYIENLKKKFQLKELEQPENKELVALKLEFYNLYKLSIEHLNKSIIVALETQDKKMAAFNLETVSKTLPLFTGNHAELESFLITGDLINKTLSETAKIDFLQYVYHAKLTSGVRTAIGNYTIPANFEILKKLLSERYKSTKTIPELQAKLSIIYQGKLSVNSYREKIMNLIDNLNKLGIEELGNEATEAEKNVIIRLNNKLALESFKKGINDNMKTAIFAARPKSFSEAVELALELENEIRSNNNTVMHIRRQQTDTNYRQNNYSNNINPIRNNYRNNHSQNPNTNFNRNNNTNSNRNNNFTNRNYNNSNRNSINLNRNDYYTNRSNNYNSNSNSGNNFNRNNNYRNYRQNQNNINTNNNHNNNRRAIHTIQDEGNVRGSEYTCIPDSQN